MKLSKKVTDMDRAQMVYDRKLKRIQRAKNPSTIIALEYVYFDYHNQKITLDDLLAHDLLKGMIERIAGAFYDRNKNKSRVTLEDFISVAYEKAWEVALDYTYKKKYFLYQYLSQGIRCSCIDFLRSQGLTKDRQDHQNNRFHTAGALDFTVPPEKLHEMEESVLMRFSILEMIDQLDPDELRVLEVYLNADNIDKVTLGVICQEVGLKWPQQANRIKEGIKSKFPE